MNDRFKFRVWDKYIQSYVKENLGEEYVWIEDDGQLGAGIDDSCILEQCTGLKDKNGNLIYEGDIIKDKFGRKFKVIWSEEDCMFEGRVIYRDPEYSDRFDFYAGATDEVEIIGNIHEQAEQKDVK